MTKKITSFLLVFCFLTTSILGYVPTRLVYGNEETSYVSDDEELSENETVSDENVSELEEETQEEVAPEEPIEEETSQETTEQEPKEEEKNEIIGEDIINNILDPEQVIPVEKIVTMPEPPQISQIVEVIEDMSEMENSATRDSSYPNNYEKLNLPKNSPTVNIVDSKKITSNEGKNGTRALEDETNSRYTVLVLDGSSSSAFAENGSIFYTADTALPDVKIASKKFVRDTLSADGNNYIAVVYYRENSAVVLSDFSNDVKALEASIDSIKASKYIRSVSAGLESAIQLIDSIEDPNAIKNVVLFTTGMTNDGAFFYSGGKYDKNTPGSGWYRTDTKVRFYAYANGANMAADVLKEKATVYTIGLFKGFNEMPVDSRDVVDLLKLSTHDWASSPDHFYDVNDPNDLEFVFGEVADEILRKSGTFKYAGDNRDRTAVYFYEDEYFNKSSYEYNPSLATMSLCLELSSWGSTEVGENYARKMKNAEELFTEIGFEDFDHNYTDFENFGIVGKPTKDSIGVVAGNKQITVDEKDYTLIALAVRGGGYESEWASNLKMGASGHHTGFSEARDQVITFLQDYIAENEIEGDIKLWITGYSRAAATANMVAGQINEGTVVLPNCNLAMEDMYAYTFETPAGASAYVKDIYARTFETPIGESGHILDEDYRYKNIFNIINLSDPVPKVAPEIWDFVRYGKDIYLPSAENDTQYSVSVSKMLERFKTLDGMDEYSVDDFVMAKFVFFENTMDQENSDRLAMLKEERRILKNRLFQLGQAMQQPINISNLQELSDEYGKCLLRYNEINEEIDNIKLTGEYEVIKIHETPEDDTPQTEFLDDTIDTLLRDYFISRDFYASQYESELTNVISIATNEYDYGYQDILKQKNTEDKEILIDSIFYADPLLLHYAVEELIIGNRMQAFVESDFSEEEDLNVSDDLMIAETLADFTLENQDTVATFYHNLHGILQSHYAEVCLAWLQSMDPYYTNDAYDKFTSGKHRVVRINCPVDVNVYNDAGELVASIISDVPQNLTSIVAGINSDGEKLVYLPASASYEVELLATDDGQVTYSLNEFNPTAGEINRLVNYYDVPITKGQRLLGQVPAYSETDLEDQTSNVSSIKYALTTNGSNVPVSNELAGDAATSAYFKINVATEDEQKGNVSGQRSRQLGTFAKVIATPRNGNIFKGWYEGDTLVSTDEEYRFRVERNRDLVAKFETVAVNVILMETEGGTVNSEINGMYDLGSTVNLEATPNDGYRFENWVSFNGGTFEDPNSPTTSFAIPNNAVVVYANFKLISDEGTNEPDEPDDTNNTDNTDNNISYDKNDADFESLTKISTEKASFDKYSPNDIEITLSSDKYTLNNIKNGNYTLIKDKDYTQDGKVYTIKSSYLSSLNNGNVSLVFNMSGGNNPKLVITIKDSQIENDILINGEKTALTLDENGFVTVNYEDIKDISDIILLSIPYENGSISDIGVLKNNDSVEVLPLSVYKDGRMFMIIEKPGVYGMVNNEKYFDDIDSHWAENTIDFITARELFEGTGNNKFNPDGNMTRAMFTTVLANFSNDDLSKYSTSSFDDVDIDLWYGKPTNWAYDKGIVTGRGNDLFAPNDLITREEMAVMLSNYIHYKGIVLDETSQNNPFSDENSISPWAKDAVLEMQKYELISGVGNNMYAPKSNANRASVAQILKNLIGKYVE